VPGQIVVAHFPKLLLYGFWLVRACFPKFWRILEATETTAAGDSTMVASTPARG